MRIKLDENLCTRGANLFRQAGHDVATVADQRLSSTPDTALIDVCRAEGRCLVMLDMNFGNPLIFAPERYAGVAVLGLPPRPTDRDIWDACRTLARGL